MFCNVISLKYISIKLEKNMYVTEQSKQRPTMLWGLFISEHACILNVYLIKTYCVMWY